MAEETADERLRMVIASLRRAAVATRAEAEKQGPSWEYFQLSLESAQAQDDQADEFERQSTA